MTEPKKPKNASDATPRTAEESANLRSENADLMGELYLNPNLTNAYALRAINNRGRKEEHLPIDGALRELVSRAAAVSNGDMKRSEAMLSSQAHTLDALFTDLTRVAYANLHNLDSVDRVLRLAMKAQAQARATVETLAAMKNPPMVFAKQANVTTGPQQVNNGQAVQRAGETETAPNKLLEAKRDEWLDTRTTGSAGREDPAVVTVGEIDGTQDRRGEG